MIEMKKYKFKNFINLELVLVDYVQHSDNLYKFLYTKDFFAWLMDFNFFDRK